MALSHPTQRFTLAALNASFAVDAGRSRRHYRIAGVEPYEPFAAGGAAGGQEAAIRTRTC